MRPSFLVAAGLAVLALAAAGCGGSDEAAPTSTAQWMDQFCTAVATWQDEADRIWDDADGFSFDRQAFEQAGEDLDTATDELVDELRALGPPDTESGQKLDDSLNALSDTLENEKADIRDALDDVSNFADIAAAISSVGSSVTAIADASGDLIRSIEDADMGDELRQAFEDTPACDALRD